MVGTPGAKQRILVDHEAEAQRLGQSNLLKVGLPLSRANGQSATLDSRSVPS